ncbi:MAG: hypothetical protein KF881_07745 [Acidobacteria bacterium]|nr:hypothetical protein [Acidobacteriota bacterium]
MIRDEIKRNYYDPGFKGFDLEQHFRAAADKMAAAESVGQLSGIIAQFLMDLDDSHLFFVPPGRINKIDYGFDYRISGDKCFVIRVKKNSDAEAKGLKVGDELWSIENVAPNRDNLWKLRYVFALRPRPVLNVEVIKSDGKKISLAVGPKITRGKPLRDLTGSDLYDFIRESETSRGNEDRHLTIEKFDKAFIWKMPSFNLEPSRVDDIMKRARNHPAVIFDLRGNGGGRVDMLQRLVGNIFNRDIKIADEKRRSEKRDLIARGRGKDAYSGNVLALIDSESGSASEIFSRVLQLEERGVVVGDRSAGAVMVSRFFPLQHGMDTVIFFGVSITVADLIMKDGRSLEKVGVVPDSFVVPSASDISARRDVVLSNALEIIGVNISPEQAGKIFPSSDER